MSRRRRPKPEHESSVTPTRQNVIVITGTPGTGKTTIARKLGKAMNAENVSLTRYVTQHKLYRKVDRERRSKIVDIAATKKSLARHLSRAPRSLIIVDGHVSEGIVPTQMVKAVIVLRCHPRVLENRLRAKNWRANKIRENILAEMLDSCLTAAVAYYGERKVMESDTSKGRVENTLALAKRALTSRRPVRRSKVDWIARLEKERLLDRYLR